MQQEKPYNNVALPVVSVLTANVTSCGVAKISCFGHAEHWTGIIILQYKALKITSLRVWTVALEFVQTHNAHNQLQN